MAYKIECIQCHTAFDSTQPHTKVCSEKCRQKRRGKIFGKYSEFSLPTPTVGSIGEMLIAVDLFKKGYAVFRALSAACFCDLIAIKNNKSIRIECRTGYRNMNGKINFPTNVHGEIDIFAVQIISEGIIAYFYKDDYKNEIKI